MTQANIYFAKKTTFSRLDVFQQIQTQLLLKIRTITEVPGLNLIILVATEMYYEDIELEEEKVLICLLLTSPIFLTQKTQLRCLSKVSVVRIIGWKML